MIELQKSSWIMMQDRIFHYQIQGKTVCGVGGMYALYEEHDPPKKDRCKECLKKLEDKK